MHLLLSLLSEKGLEGKTGSQLGPNRARPNISHHATTMFFLSEKGLEALKSIPIFYILRHVLCEKGPSGDAMFVRD